MRQTRSRTMVAHATPSMSAHTLALRAFTGCRPHVHSHDATASVPIEVSHGFEPRRTLLRRSPQKQPSEEALRSSP